MTPRDTSSAETDHKESQSSREQSPEPHPSTFAFPSEDEPVTMISKSIPPSVMSVSSASSRQRTSRQGAKNVIWGIVVKVEDSIS